ncbi:kinase-like domain-containing protein [Boletus edulis]|nr:kinase-like domain-containing protein [Boletus edulis]
MVDTTSRQHEPAGRGLSNTLATVPNLSDKIIKSDDQYCNAGGFSDVYKRQYDSGAGLVEVAVKSFRFLFSLDEAENDSDRGRRVRAQKMIRRELGIWRRLEHQNIVPFLGIAYGFGGQGHASLVSMWMANGSLQSFLAEYDDRLTIAHRLRLLSDIVDGLCYLHSFAAPIIHGDLSCNNVLLDDDYNARLTDFGYASMIGDIPETSLYLQMTTMKPGTLRWAAPEHFLADVEQTMQPTTQSDIYSFGNLGLFVLSGKHPWSEIQRETAIIIQLLRGVTPKRPSSRPIEDRHWELIERCWAPVGDRPAATDVVSSVQQFLHSFPPPLPLVDICRTTDHHNAVFPDGKYALLTLGLMNSRLLRL